MKNEDLWRRRDETLVEARGRMAAAQGSLRVRAPPGDEPREWTDRLAREGMGAYLRPAQVPRGQ